jgi:hypothetical protein
MEDYMRFTVVRVMRFEPITVSITVESKEELMEITEVLGKAKMGSFLKPVYDDLADRF